MTPRADTNILAEALDILARDIQSEDGVANAAIAEAAERLRELHAALELAAPWLPWHEPDHPDYEGARSDAGRAVRDATRKP